MAALASLAGSHQTSEEEAVAYQQQTASSSANFVQSPDADQPLRWTVPRSGDDGLFAQKRHQPLRVSPR